MSDDQKMLPESMEAEVSALGAILISPETWPKVAAMLSPEDFSRPAHAEVFKACATVAASGAPPELVTVADELKRNKRLDAAGGLAYLAQLVDAVPSAVNAEHYALIVKRHALWRKQVTIGRSLTADAMAGGEDPARLVEKYRALLEQVRLPERAAEETLTEALRTWDLTQGLPFRTAGIRMLDRALGGGLEPGTYAILGARPSIGKTSICIQMLRGMAKAGMRCGLLSCEMDERRIRVTALAQEARIENTRIRHGLQGDELRDGKLGVGALQRLPFQSWRGSGITPGNFPAVAERYVREAKLDVFALDYIQLVRGGQLERREQASLVSKALADLAHQNGIITIGLSQLTRFGKLQAGREPELDDLKESGDLEQDADVVVFLHFPKRRDGFGNGKMDLIVAKNRTGSVGFVEGAWVARYTLFEEEAHGDDAERERTDPGASRAGASESGRSGAGGAPGGVSAGTDAAPRQREFGMRDPGDVRDEPPEAPPAADPGRQPGDEG